MPPDLLDEALAFQRHLSPADLLDARRELLCALLRQPGLRHAIKPSGISAIDFPAALRLAFRMATSDGDIDKRNPNIQKLTLLGVVMTPGEALRVARQIVETGQRNRRAEVSTSEPDDS
jgi:hypothetical protein